MRGVDVALGLYCVACALLIGALLHQRMGPGVADTEEWTHEGPEQIEHAWQVHLEQRRILQLVCARIYYILRHVPRNSRDACVSTCDQCDLSNVILELHAGLPRARKLKPLVYVSSLNNLHLTGECLSSDAAQRGSCDVDCCFASQQTDAQQHPPERIQRGWQHARATPAPAR